MHIDPESVFAALSNETRLRCISLLLSEKELCVCEFTYIVGAAQPNVSRHLAQLREAGLVEERREGQWIYYRINTNLPVWIVDSLNALKAGMRNRDPYKTDKAVVKAMPNRRTSARCA